MNDKLMKTKVSKSIDQVKKIDMIPLSSSSCPLSLLLCLMGAFGKSPFPVVTLPLATDFLWCFFLFFMIIFRLRTDGGGKCTPGSN